MDVYGPLNVSLDYRLRFSPTVVEIIHQLLGLICDTMVSCKYPPRPPIQNPPQTPSRKRQRVSGHSDSEGWRRRPEDDASDSDSDGDPAEENISKITDIIGGTVTRLFRLSNAVRKSAKADRARRIERYRDDEQANQAIAELRLYTDCYIRFRFPMAPDSLRTALIEANAVRLRRLYYQRTHRRRIGLSVQHPRTAPTVVQLPKINGSAPTVRFDSSMLPKPATTRTILGAASPPPVPLTNATTARQSAVRALYAKSTTEVPRAKSVLVNNKLSFPPLPPTDECPYCGVIIEFKSRAKPMLWHNHVIRDLEPFICVSAQCLEAGHHGTGPATFETSGAWISHMQNAHGHTWECRAPSHDPTTFDEEVHYREHAIQEHGVPATHVGTLSLAARRPLLDRILECPFGDDFQPPDKVEPNAVFSSEALQSHVAAHIKEIALITLQKLPSDNEEDAEKIDSDQPLEDDVPGFAKFRASMYSVMDDEALEYRDDDAVAADGSKDHGEEDITASVTKLDLQDKEGSKMAELYNAIQAGDLILVQSLTHGGAGLDNRDEEGRTALHYASMEEGLTDIISILVEHGADIGRIDNHGFTPCLWAAVAGQTQATDELLNIGADANAVSADGKSALHWAAGLGWSSVAELLLDHGASISQKANRHRAPLETAAASGDLPTVQMLLFSGGDPNHQDQDGWSAIHFAAEEGHFETV
ncbi:ankyrin repeat domain-containing protein, partial [Aspergillus saccharolyticus JOP 1030-1]